MPTKPTMDKEAVIAPTEPQATSMETVSDPKPKNEKTNNPTWAGDSEMERRESMVQDLARRYSSAPGHTNPFLNSDGDSPLNPASENFKPREWAKAIIELDSAAFRKSGVCYQNLSVHGHGTTTDYQKNLANIWLGAEDTFRAALGLKCGHKIQILQGFDGLVRSGEMLVVLGPPGSGCSSFLKTIAGETHGMYVNEDVYLNYQGISPNEMHRQHKGDCIYTAETDVHFPMLTVGDTLSFASRAYAPRSLPPGVDKVTYTNHLRDVTMAMFGISHTVNTCVGNEYIRGISGGERKRVSISEAALSRAPLQCWDNSTRGLDSANAIEFCKTLRIQSDIFDTTACVSMYQAPQSAYDLFDKVLVIYEGRQIFFGKSEDGKSYFEKLGFRCPDRQTTPDFLTSMTNPSERVVRPGFEATVPRMPDEFALAWRKSDNYTALQDEIDEYRMQYPIGGSSAADFRQKKKQIKASSQREKSPFTLSYMAQLQLCLWRGGRRFFSDPSITIGAVIGNTCVAFIIASIFYNMQLTTKSFYQRGSLIFYSTLSNAFSSSLEVLTLYAQRPIVEKQSRYAMYHPSAEAISAMIWDLPFKVINTLFVNIVIYFLSNLKRESGAFFFFLLISFSVVLVTSMIFRTIGAGSRTLAQAMVPAAILMLALIMFTGFVLPFDYMLGWCRWIYYINPLSYAFESLMVNEFHNREYRCSQIVPDRSVPGYDSLPESSYICSTIGSVAGSSFVRGDDYVGNLFGYHYSNRWRNFGIICAFTTFFMISYIVVSEFATAKRPRGEILLFRRGHMGSQARQQTPEDAENALASTFQSDQIESPSTPNTSQGSQAIESHQRTFHWRNVCYEVPVKGETKHILDKVDGWVKPGTLTALMGVSGAGKTTLLDALADRLTVGVLTGEMLIDGHLRDASFQRKTGYVQQQDLHLATSTVREALNFSALLRQPKCVPIKEKLAYVDEVLKMLEMEEYADAVVGVLGEGLNVEQRKRLSIGVELSAKPPLLLFVDEPTSGLDSQTSWSILSLLQKLANSGQAILCTIHQPSSVLFERFDRMLLLEKGGRTVYFGELGENASTLISYFERNGALSCPPDANPAEWMLQVTGAAPGSHSDVDWFKTWRGSPEYDVLQAELQSLQSERKEPNTLNADTYTEFATDFTTQFTAVTGRVFEQYWRTPAYVYSKVVLCVLSALFIGFCFYRAENTIQGLQNQIFSIFNIFLIFSHLVQQIMPQFISQRDLYEARERPSKVYSWVVFTLAQILVELVWNSLVAVVIFFCWYYPIGLQRNAIPTGQVTERGALMFLLIWGFLLFTSTFSDMVIAAVDTAEAGSNIANILFMLTLVFCGVLSTPDQFPRFWIFMYYLSPFTYIISAALSTAIANTSVHCAANELLRLNPPTEQTCEQFLGPYVQVAGGYITNETIHSFKDCMLCPISESNVFLSSVKSYYSDRWRNLGIVFGFVVFNILGALFFYWLARVPKNQRGNRKHKAS